MITASLGKIVDIIKGRKLEESGDEGKYRYIQIADLRNDDNLKYTNDKGVLAQKNDLIIAWDGAYAGTVGYGLHGMIGSTLALLRISDKSIYTPYIGRLLQAKFSYFRSTATGVTIPHIRRKSLENLMINIPPLTTQKRIAGILDKADALRKKRQETLLLADQFLKSVFLEMFGDPALNPNNFDRVTVGDVVTHVKDGPHVSPEYVNEGIPILSTRNIRPGKLLLEDVKYVSIDQYDKLIKKFNPQMDDVLLTKGGTTGYAKVVDFSWPFCVWVHLAVLRPKKELIHPIYLENALNSKYCYQQSQKYTHGITNRDLGLTRLINIKLLLPPMELQNQFTEIVNKHNKIQKNLLSSLSLMDEQFNSLVQRAFRGEL